MPRFSEELKPHEQILELLREINRKLDRLEEAVRRQV